MTYAEKITYLIGNYVEICQYVIKNSYRIVALSEYQKKKRIDIEPLGLEINAETYAVSLLKDNVSFSGKECCDFFSGKGISDKDFSLLKKVLLKKDYFVNLFYIDNAKSIAREEVAVYESIIKEIDEDIERAKKLNVSLAKSADSLACSFH